MADKNTKSKIAIIGGGACGMTAAIFAARSKKAYVTVFEARESVGKKINATGNGKCNFTNLNMGIEFYRGEDPEFARYALESFGVKETLEFFKSMGIRPKIRNGYVYPNSEEASSVSEALRLTAESEGVKFVFEEVKDIKFKNPGFTVNSQNFDKVILACGSFANRKNISEFTGYSLAKKLGHKITALYPSLCQIRCEGKTFKTINGVRCEAKIKALIDGKTVDEEKGELLFTDYGVSGIPAFQVSRFCAEGCDHRKNVELEIDLAPELSENELLNELEERMDYSNRTVEECLFGLFNHKLNFVLLNFSGINPTGNPAKEITAEKLKKLDKNIKELKFKVTGTNDFSFAQVVAGGVKTSEVSEKTMESKLVKGLYFAGEILDIDGTCGGYNLQWAWSSGSLAGKAAVSND